MKHGGILGKWYIPSPKTLYTEDLSNITFNYLWENSPNYLCHFWNNQSFFTTQLLCIFLAKTLHVFYKSTPPKCKFSDFVLLSLKFSKFLMSFFKQNVRFCSKFGSFFSVMRDNSFMPFSMKLYMLLTKVGNQSADFLTFHCWH